MHPYLKFGPMPHQRSRSARMVKVYMGQQEPPGAPAFECRQELRDARSWAAVDQHVIDPPCPD